MSELGAYSAGGRKDNTELVFLSTNRQKRAMVDIERMGNRSSTYEEALEMVRERLEADAHTAIIFFNKGGAGQEQRNSSTDPGDK